MKNLLSFLFLLICTVAADAQITLDINPDFRHLTGTVDSFDRSRFVKIHADNTESDWNGINFSPAVNLRDTVLNGYDVYMGRNTGGISFHFSQVQEDPNRPGYASPIDMAQRGENSRNNYAAQPSIHQYDDRNNLIIAPQQRPFYPDGTPTQQGWAPAGGDAVGEFTGRYVNEFFGGEGKPAPAYVEVMNEPLYELTTIDGIPPLEIFEFHNDFATAYKAQNSDIPLGGYCAAFPDFEKDNFNRWHERDKLFMDTAGENMDFWSLHFYEFTSPDGFYRLRRGNNIEATFDMQDHYSMLSFGEVKPYVISEFGGRALNYEADPWTPYRDWLCLKSMLPLLMSMAERPQDIMSAIPFIPVKAEWGQQANGNPYPWRLMRRADEMPGETGTHWVFTDLVKYYQLLSEIRGTRIETEATEPDLLSNAYVNGNELFVMLHNLTFQEQTVDLNLTGITDNELQNIATKQLYENAAGNGAQLEELTFTTLPTTQLAPEGTMVIKYTFADDIIPAETVQEKKYFATTHLTPIIGNAIHEFAINGIVKEAYGEAILRIGVGRAHGKNLQPTVFINGFEIAVPADYRGPNQEDTRPDFFGILEVPVPFYYLQADNEITVQFPDAGGHISSMILQVFNHSAPLPRSQTTPVTALTLTPPETELAIADNYQLTATVTPTNAADPTLTWTSSDESTATVDAYGNVTALALGQTIITAAAADGTLTAQSVIDVVEVLTPIVLTGFAISPVAYTMTSGELLQLQAEFFPFGAIEQDLVWTSADESIAVVDADGLVTPGTTEGTTTVTATTADGAFSANSVITVEFDFPLFVKCDLLPTAVNAQNQYVFEVEYSTNEAIDVAVELKNADNLWQGEGQTTVNPGQGTVSVTLDPRNPPDWGEVYTPPPGNYTLIAWIRDVNGNWQTNNGGCSSPLIIESDTATEMPAALQNMMLYPNPTGGDFTLELPDLAGTAELTIYDSVGRVVLHKKINAINARTAGQNLVTGVYFVQVTTENGTVSRRLVIE